MVTTKFIRAGDWRTVESFWNAKGKAFFRLPAGAKIKVRYGYGWFGKDRQVQTLDASSYKSLEVGVFSLILARMQVRVEHDTDITYDVYGDGVAVTSPKVPF